jgi:hypothetical protein
VSRTPGFIDPSAYSSPEMVTEKLQELNKEFGFTPLGEELLHSSDVTHYGVKGMHWGQRKSSSGGGSTKLTKAQLNAAHPDYSTRDRTRDALAHPAGAVKRINQRMNKGMDLRTARKKEGQRTLLKAAGLVALYNAPKIIRAVDGMVATHGANTMASIRVKAQTNRGRAQAAATMGLPSKPTNGPSYAKKNRQGVHNIRSF